MKSIFGALVVGTPGVILATLAAATAFWIPGLGQHQASALAAIVFPCALLAYVFASWRNGIRKAS